jgi:predicted DCC family thiol-disulfide oxidoreductase YuxK
MGYSRSPLLVFDGDCAFCTRSASWIEAGWRGNASAIAWQRLDPTQLQELGLTPDDCREAAWWIDSSGSRYKGHRAIGQALLAATGWKRPLGRVILAPPLSPIAAIVYRVIARLRFRFPRGSAACRLPGP